MTTQPIEWIMVEPWGRLGIRDWSGRVFVHCEITKWSLSTRRQCVAKWAEFKADMRARGVRVLYSAVPSGDAKVCAWQQLFGQRYVKTINDTAIFLQEI